MRSCGIGGGLHVTQTAAACEGTVGGREGRVRGAARKGSIWVRGSGILMREAACCSLTAVTFTRGGESSSIRLSADGNGAQSMTHRRRHQQHYNPKPMQQGYSPNKENTATSPGNRGETTKEGCHNRREGDKEMKPSKPGIVRRGSRECSYPIGQSKYRFCSNVLFATS